MSTETEGPATAHAASMLHSEILAILRRAIADPGSVIPRGRGESVSSWSARAAMVTIDDHPVLELRPTGVSENSQKAEVEQLRAERDRLEAELTELANAELGEALNHSDKCPAVAERDALKAELGEIKRVTEPPVQKEMPTDPAELKELWEFINQQGRWQWHMAHKFGGQVEGLRAELAEARAAIERVENLMAAARGIAALGSKAVLVTDLRAALDAPQRPEDTRPGSWLEQLADASLSAARAKFGPGSLPERPEDTREADRLTPHRDVMVAAVQDAAALLDAWGAELTALQAGAVVDAVLDAVRKAEDTREETGS